MLWMHFEHGSYNNNLCVVQLQNYNKVLKACVHQQCEGLLYILYSLLHIYWYPSDDAKHCAKHLWTEL